MCQIWYILKVKLNPFTTVYLDKWATLLNRFNFKVYQIKHITFLSRNFGKINFMSKIRQIKFSNKNYEKEK